MDITQQLLFSEGLDFEALSTLPKVPVTDQILAWQEMQQWFTQQLRPTTSIGQRYFTAYRQADLDVAAAVRRIGYHRDWEEHSTRAFELLEPLL